MEYSVKDHFKGKDPAVKAIYDSLISTTEKWGPVKEEAKKTSIHLVRKSAFAGVATRKSALILTIKSKTDLNDPRITKHQQASASRWYLYLRLESPKAVDRQLKGWLKASYELSS